jgi:hypothetical protein
MSSSFEDAEFLEERRGGVDGPRYLLASPWRDDQFKVVTIYGAFALAFDLYLLFRASFNSIVSVLLIVSALGMSVAWAGALMKIQDLKALYLNESALEEVEPDSAFAVALGLAVGGILGSLRLYFYTMLLILPIVGFIMKAAR